MKTQERIDYHEKCIHLLEKIQQFERMLATERHNIAISYAGFPDLQERAKKRIKQIQRSLEILETKYKELNNGN